MKHATETVERNGSARDREPATTKTERIFDGAKIIKQRRVEWTGMRAELLTSKRDRIFEIELLTGNHALFMGVEGAPHRTTVEADGAPNRDGVKGEGLSAFFAAGRRMRS